MWTALIGSLASVICIGCGRIGFEPVGTTHDDAADDTAGDTGIGARWTLIQHAGSSCGGPTPNCETTILPTGANDLLVVITTAGTIQTGDGQISSVVGGGTWVHPPTCFKPSDPGIDCAYVLACTTGATAVTVTFTGTNNHVQDEVIEYSYAGGPIDLDTAADLSTPSGPNPMGVMASLSGSNDVIVQAISFSTVVSAISAPYSSPAEFLDDGTNSMGVGGSINTTSGIAPMWTAPFSTGPEIAIAFKPI